MALWLRRAVGEKQVIKLFALLVGCFFVTSPPDFSFSRVGLSAGNVAFDVSSGAAGARKPKVSRTLERIVPVGRRFLDVDATALSLRFLGMHKQECEHEPSGESQEQFCELHAFLLLLTYLLKWT